MLSRHFVFANLFGGITLCGAFSLSGGFSFAPRMRFGVSTIRLPINAWQTSTVRYKVKCAAEDAPRGRASAAVLQDKDNKAGKSKSDKLDLQPPRGTRDFYPEDMRLRNWLFSKWKDTARLYGFEEYDAPVLENEELYIRKAGEEVSQQLYNFVDKGDRPVTLRPEMTPSLARMVMSKGKGLNLPVKWFSIPQWNMDIWGVAGIEAEAELLSAVVSFFRSVGLSPADVGIKVNSRAVLSEVMGRMGVPEDKFAATCVLVDKLDKVKLEDIRGDMEALGLSAEVIDGLVATLALKDLDALQAALGAESPALAQLQHLFTLAEAYGVREWLVFDAGVVRGLAYYTGVVFEGFDRGGTLRAICGGGRYDRLLESFGGEPLPACGFGLGDAVIVELLRDKGLLPHTSTGAVDALVFALAPAQQAAAAAAARALRAAGISADLVMGAADKKVKWAFKQAERVGAARVVLIGEEEAARGGARVKTLADGTQVDVTLAELPSVFGRAAPPA